MKVTETTITRNRYTINAIQTLISTNYVNLKISVLKKLIRISAHCKWVNSDMVEIGILYSNGKDAPKASLDFIKKFSKMIKEDIPLITSIINLNLNDLKQNKKEQIETPIWMWDSDLQKLLK